MWLFFFYKGVEKMMSDALYYWLTMESSNKSFFFSFISHLHQQAESLVIIRSNEI